MDDARPVGDPAGQQPRRTGQSEQPDRAGQGAVAAGDAPTASPGTGEAAPAAGGRPEPAPGTATAPGTPTVSEPVRVDPAPPGEWEADVVLRDGSLARVRPITPADAPAVHRFHDAQSAESVYLRFFAPIKHLSERDVHRFTHVDHDQRVALVAVVGDDIIGIARYDRLDDPTVAEVAFNISDHFHGRGVGSVLLEHLAAIGNEGGVRRFVADVLPQNRKMMKVFTDAGYQVEHHFDDGVISVSFTIEPTAESQAVQLAREHRAEARSIGALLSPSVIAVVGVSRRPEAIGSVVLDAILDGGFTGTVHVVNSEARTFRGLKAVPRVSDIPETVDLAVVAVPAEAVLDVVDDCGAAGVKTLVVVSSGFAETGPEGEERQAGLLRRARAHGMRVVGPNSIGLVNTRPDVRLDATTVRIAPQPGTVGLYAQSGGIGVGLLDQASRRSMGVSVFAAGGNRIDVSGNDLMQFWIDDEQTEVVGMFLESVGNARKFSRIARQLSLRKPVVCVTSGSGRRVPPGHRARATRVGSAAFDAMLEQAGVIPAASIHRLLDVCEFMSHQPLPAGSRLAVVGNSPGLAAIIADSAAQAGLRVTHGPVDLPTDVRARDVVVAVEKALADPEVDTVAACFVAPLASGEEEVAAALSHASWGYDKPCISAFIGTRDVNPVMRRTGRLVPGSQAGRRVVPVHDSPNSLVEVVAAAATYAAWRDADHGERIRPTGIDRAAAQALVARVLAEAPDGRELTDDEASDLLRCYGVHVWPRVAVADADAAVAAAEELGFPVVLTSAIPSVQSRPGAGGLRADLYSGAAVREAFASLSTHLAAFGDPRIRVQKMPPHGVGTVLRTTEDPLFGPVVSFGLSGAPSELLGDVAHRIPPLTDVDVHSLVTSIAAAPLLLGRDGEPPVDLPALQDVVTRASVLADEIPDVRSMVLARLNLHPGGADVLGARVEVAPADARTDAGRRALS